MMRIVSAYKKGFWYLAVMVAKSLKKTKSNSSLKFGPIMRFLYFKPILAAIFATIATAIVT